MYKITKETKDAITQLIAQATHPNVTYAQVNQILQKLDFLEEIKEEKENNKQSIQN